MLLKWHASVGRQMMGTLPHAACLSFKQVALAIAAKATDRQTLLVQVMHRHTLVAVYLCLTHTYRHTPATACLQALYVHLQPQLLPSWWSQYRCLHLPSHCSDPQYWCPKSCISLWRGIRQCLFKREVKWAKTEEVINMDEVTCICILPCLVKEMFLLIRRCYSQEM